MQEEFRGLPLCGVNQYNEHSQWIIGAIMPGQALTRWGGALLELAHFRQGSEAYEMIQQVDALCCGSYTAPWLPLRMALFITVDVLSSPRVHDATPGRREIQDGAAHRAAEARRTVVPWECLHITGVLLHAEQCMPALSHFATLSVSLHDHGCSLLGPKGSMMPRHAPGLTGFVTAATGLLDHRDRPGIGVFRAGDGLL